MIENQTRSAPGEEAAISMRAAQQRIDSLVADAPVHRLPSGAQICAALVAFMLAMGIAMRWVALAAGTVPGSQFDPGSTVREKHEAFARHGDEFDLVFVGTSRVYRQFDASLFDERASTLLPELGDEFRSFNFGVGGMRHPEMRHVVRWILERKPRKLRYLLIELVGELTHDIDGLLHERNAYTRRVIDWHSPDVTAFLLRAVWESDRLTTLEKTEAISSHLHHLAIRMCNVGYGVRALQTAFGGARSGRWLDPAWNGHQYLEDDPEGNPVKPQRLPRIVAPARLELLAQPKGGSPNAILSASLAEMTEEVVAAGVVPIFVLMPPHWFDDLLAYDGEHTHGLPALLGYRDPERYPEFYDPDHFYNFNHLNTAGSRLLTERIARDFAQSTAGGGTAHPAVPGSR